MHLKVGPYFCCVSSVLSIYIVYDVVMHFEYLINFNVSTLCIIE